MLEPTMELIISYFDAQGYRYELDESETTVRSGFQGENSAFPLLIHYEPGADLLMYRVNIVATVPERQRLKTVDLLNRVNWLIHLGNFEMDMQDGEIIFRVSADLEDAEFNSTQVKNYLECCLSVCDRAFPAIQMVIWGNTEPEAALQVFQHGRTVEPTLTQ